VVHSREFAGAVATHWVSPPPDTTHHVDRSLHLLAAIGVPDQGRSPSLRVPAEAYAEADVVLGGISNARRPVALLVPGASCPSRRYPAGRFGAAAAAVAAGGLPVLVAGTAAEADLVAEVVRAAGSPDVVALPAVGLPAFTALIARAVVALTNNSGGLHLADAVGTPVVATFAGTERLGDVAPRTVPSELLQVPTACSPCRQLACPFHLECLDVAPARIAAAALRLAKNRDSTAETTQHPVPDTPESDTPEEDRWPHDPTPARIA
jgi:ADP-heptose:LPS heptosyltransferase